MYLIMIKSVYGEEPVFTCNMTHDVDLAYKYSKSSSCEVYKMSNIERIVQFNVSYEEVKEQKE